jgi:hypothetical protein
VPHTEPPAVLRLTPTPPPVVRRPWVPPCDLLDELAGMLADDPPAPACCVTANNKPESEEGK